MPSEMTAMNSTLILLNALALAVLVFFQFQPDETSGQQSAEIAGTYKPHSPLPQLAVMTPDQSGTPHLTAEHPAQTQAVQGDSWVF